MGIPDEQGAPARPAANQPRVSVRVPTYNHVRYIAQCLEGILMQRTDFPFEVVIGEDYSTDGTREIVAGYAEGHPDLIRVVTSQENVGPSRNIVRLNEACRGRYLAMCEGDDYWIDPLKLQKQVDFMEAHPECPMCFHDAIVVHADKSRLPRYFCPRDLPAMVTMEDICMRDHFIATAGTLIRSDIVAGLPSWRTEVWCSDLVVRLWCAHDGPLGYIDEIMSVYRVHQAGMSAAVRKDVKKAFSGVEHAYRAFDKETGFRHTELVERALRRVRRRYQDEWLRQRWGRFYFVLYPHRGLDRVSQCIQVLRRYRCRKE